MDPAPVAPPSTHGCSMQYGPLRIAYDDRVLRPRSWTRAQAEWAAALLPDLPAGPVLELCSGVGHIGLLAIAGSDRRLVSVDVAEPAASYARDNAAAAGLADRVDVRLGAADDVLGPDERFALVIADPPWVPRDGVGRYPDDPVLAIDGGPDGLTVARECVGVADRVLAPAGVVLLQLGSTGQVDLLCEDLDGALGVVDVREFAGRGVVALLSRPSPSAPPRTTRRTPPPSAGR